MKRVTKNVPSQQSIVSFPEEASDVLKRENFILLRIVGGKGRQKRESVCPLPFLFYPVTSNKQLIDSSS